MTSVYEGHTIFSIFFYNPSVFEHVLNRLKTRQFEDTIDEFKKPAEDSFKRRLYRILVMPTADNNDTS